VDKKKGSSKERDLVTKAMKVQGLPASTTIYTAWLGKGDTGNQRIFAECLTREGGARGDYFERGFVRKMRGILRRERRTKSISTCSSLVIGQVELLWAITIAKKEGCRRRKRRVGVEKSGGLGGGEKSEGREECRERSCMLTKPGRTLTELVST